MRLQIFLGAQHILLDPAAVFLITSSKSVTLFELMDRLDDFKQFLEGLSLCRVVDEDEGIDPLFARQVPLWLIFNHLLQVFLHLLCVFVLRARRVREQQRVILREAVQDLYHHKVRLVPWWRSILVNLVGLELTCRMILWVEVVVYQTVHYLGLAHEARP